jgi:hypothetical protein
MHDRISNGAYLWKEQVFQFDFLNDDFIPVSKGGKLPDKLFQIINNPVKRKKLIFLINPPYGEAGTGQGRENKAGVKESKTKERFNENLGGLVLNEKYVQFFVCIQVDVPDCKMAAFVKSKYICSPNMKKFRDFWKAGYLSGFATPATTHDNCSGEYPICLFIWDLAVKNDFPEKVPCDVFNENEEYEGVKTFYSYHGKKYIIDWLRESYDKKDSIGFLRINGNDFQHQDGINILSIPTERDAKKHMTPTITQNNLTQFCIYFSARLCISATWLNDRDQFLYPNDGWKTDKEFQNDCLIYALFHGQNKIKSREGVNHWIPFTEAEVNCKKRFESRFMSDFISGKTTPPPDSDAAASLDGKNPQKQSPLKFSSEASAVFDAGRELWKYYHNQSNANANASFYEIREHFQGRKANGNMNTKSADSKYNELIGALRDIMKILAKKIEPKVYEYGFLLE